MGHVSPVVSATNSEKVAAAFAIAVSTHKKQTPTKRNLGGEGKAAGATNAACAARPKKKGR